MNGFLDTLSELAGGWFRGPRVALGLAPGTVRLLVATGNGRLKPGHDDAAGFAAGALEPGLRSPNLVEPEAVGAALESLLQEARRAGALRRRPGLLTLVLPDAAIRMSAVAVEGEGASPKRTAGQEMARWALRDVLPDDDRDVRVDWTVMGSDREAGAGIGPAGEGEGAEVATPSASWLLAIGAETEVIREYEAMAGRVGRSAGRVVPWSLAVAAAAEEGSEGTEGEAAAATPSELPAGPGGRLVLCGVGDRMACLLEEADVPRFHRAWRGSLREVELDREIPSLGRYAREKLDLRIDEAVLCGPSDWETAAGEICRSRGWRTRRIGIDAALLASLVIP